jgi:hypothetical protein
MTVHVRPSGDRRIIGGHETRHGSSRWGEDEVDTQGEIVPERFQKVRVSWAQVSGYGMRRLVASNQTLFPTFHGENFLEDLSVMIRRADSCAAKASFLAASKEDKRVSRAGRKDFPSGG